MEEAADGMGHLKVFRILVSGLLLLQREMQKTQIDSIRYFH